jgi:hypothetical protein
MMETLRASKIYHDARFTLIAIESVVYEFGKSKHSCHLLGKLEPRAIVICSDDSVYALDRDAKLISVEQLSKDVPALAAMLTGYDVAG